jgi:hypothetical protein
MCCGGRRRALFKGLRMFDLILESEIDTGKTALSGEEKSEAVLPNYGKAA